VNPEHLEAVTCRENVQRGQAANPKNTAEPRMHKAVGAIRPHKTHCKNGHLLDPDNTYWRKNQFGRDCRACATARSLKYQKRQRELGKERTL